MLCTKNYNDTFEFEVTYKILLFSFFYGHGAYKSTLSDLKYNVVNAHQ